MGTVELGVHLDIAASVVLISVIGGRVIPSFTHNWLTRENPGRLPVPFGRFDIGVLVLSLIALAVWIANPTWAYTGALMLAAGAAIPCD